MTPVTPAPATTPNAHEDLESMDEIQLAEARNQLRELARQRGAGPSIDAGIPFTTHLSEDECGRLIAIINCMRRRAGKGPKAASKGKPQVATQDLLSL